MNNFVAPEVGRLQRRDVPSDLLDGDAFSVAVVTDWGHVIRVELQVAEVWQARGWSRIPCCPACNSPARVLRAVDGQLRCGRCAPVRSAAASVSRTRRRRSGSLGDATLPGPLDRQATTTRRATQLAAAAAATVRAIELDS